ncbi:DUF3558 family protein [Prauserella alba]|uniref:DUF3558 domain-containing protein n=1 Tax=Prauserella alba TaxID=176898 RepID=A0ABP4GE82_9PSEU|nr:DUF3558 family protein [Prauserella alba]
MPGRRTGIVAMLSGAGLLGASACGAIGGDAAAGAGGAAPNTPPSNTAPSETPPSDTAPSDGTAADSDPCAWLTPAERSTAGLTVPGERRTVGSVRACDYTEPGAGGVTVTFDTTSALADLRPDGPASPLRIAGREARRVADLAADDGTCTVLLAAGATASVHIDVSTADFRGTRESCDRAAAVAELIAPDLPGRAG